MSDTIKIQANGKLRCPRHGAVEVEYRQQDPAPCGCAWVWETSENGQQVLVAQPSGDDLRELVESLFK